MAIHRYDQAARSMGRGAFVEARSKGDACKQAVPVPIVAPRAKIIGRAIATDHMTAPLAVDQARLLAMDANERIELFTGQRAAAPAAGAELDMVATHSAESRGPSGHEGNDGSI